MVKCDKAVILGLFRLLTFSPCEDFLPVYLSGIKYGWAGFVVLRADRSRVGERRVFSDIGARPRPQYQSAPAET